MGEEGYKKRAKEGEYGRNVMYSYMKNGTMRPAETILKWGGGRR
jgi:hypothetical protein